MIKNKCKFLGLVAVSCLGTLFGLTTFHILYRPTTKLEKQQNTYEHRLVPLPKVDCPTFKAGKCQPTFIDHHYLSSEPPFGCRLNEVQERCRERQIPPMSLLSERFKYGKQLDLVLCEMPKVASTTWQAVLMKLNGFPGEITKELIKKYSYHRFPLKTFAGLHPNAAKEIVNRYTTFMITRHPFERLVSAHSEKFTNRSDMNWYRRNVGIGIARAQAADYIHGMSLGQLEGNEDMLKNTEIFKGLNKQEQDDVIRYRHVVKTGEISFQQFIRFVLKYHRDKNPEKMDIHWRPQVLVCQPCTFEYSYIMRFENLVQESNRLLEYIQQNRDTNITFPGKSKPTVQNPATIAAMKLISEVDVQKLRDLYKDDFYILGHDPFRYSGHP